MNALAKQEIHPKDNFTLVSNDIVDLLMPNISGNEFKIISVIIRKTVGWNKLSDKISYSQFVQISGCSLKTVQRSIISLKEKNIISQSIRQYRTDIYEYRVNSSIIKKTYSQNDRKAMVILATTKNTKQKIKNTTTSKNSTILKLIKSVSMKFLKNFVTNKKENSKSEKKIIQLLKSKPNIKFTQPKPIVEQMDKPVLYLVPKLQETFKKESVIQESVIQESIIQKPVTKKVISQKLVIDEKKTLNQIIQHWNHNTGHNVTENEIATHWNRLIFKFDPDKIYSAIRAKIENVRTNPTWYETNSGSLCLNAFFRNSCKDYDEPMWNPVVKWSVNYKRNEKVKTKTKQFQSLKKEVKKQNKKIEKKIEEKNKSIILDTKPLEPKPLNSTPVQKIQTKEKPKVQKEKNVSKTDLERWLKTKDNLKDNMKERFFKTFIKPLEIIDFQNNTAMLRAKTEKLAHHVKECYSKDIEKEFNLVNGSKVNIKVIV